jgi:bacteriorhodopsin
LYVGLIAVAQNLQSPAQEDTQYILVDSIYFLLFLKTVVLFVQYFMVGIITHEGLVLEVIFQSLIPELF